MILKPVRRFLERRRYPTLMLIGALLFVIDLAIPDPLPFIDEILILIATLLIGSLRGKRSSAEEEGEEAKRGRGRSRG
ncbi:MAG: DUF6116 family protein [Wenzhouxiangellaceae bacterium]|nr:DUF6116 family protein [Wenzhouxiangellaceae bacterium]